jgi:GUN4-like/TIR domain
MSKKPLVFLAHNSQDKPQVRIVADALKQKGINTWLDEEQIPPGVLFQEHLQKAIAEIDYALIFIGKSGVGQWQAIEIQSFFSKLVSSRIPVIPVLLPGVKKLPDDMVFLAEINHVQFHNGIEDQNTINKIIWGITNQPNYINYDPLESFLRGGLWREANNETRRIILQVANREKDRWLSEQEMRDLDDNVLLKLDDFWRQYSRDRFGFSVQKRLLKGCEKDAVAFGTEVGWKHLGGWVDAAHVNYSLAAPVGHLPYGMLQLVELNNAIVEGIVDAQWAVTKVLVTKDWQRQLISDAVGLFELVGGNKNFDSGEFKKGLDFQLKHDEAWWQGERAEVMKIKNLCLLLFSCSLLDTVEDFESSSSPVTDQTNKEDNSDKQSVGFSQVNTGNGTGWQVNVSGGTVNINPPNR